MQVQEHIGGANIRRIVTTVGFAFAVLLFPFVSFVLFVVSKFLLQAPSSALPIPSSGFSSSRSFAPLTQIRQARKGTTLALLLLAFLGVLPVRRRRRQAFAFFA